LAYSLKGNSVGKNKQSPSNEQVSNCGSEASILALFKGLSRHYYAAAIGCLWWSEKKRGKR
jgi:hypothetical protein